MLLNLAFCLFLFIQPISSENYPWEFVLEEMGKFAKDFKRELKNFDRMLGEIGDKKKAKEFLGQEFVEGIFEKGFINKIEKMKNEVGKYLQGKTTLAAIFSGLNKLKLDKERFEALEAIKQKSDEAQRHQFFMLEKSTSATSSTGSAEKKQRKLVDKLSEMQESMHKFVGETFVKLHLQEMLNNLRAQQKALENPYGEIMEKYSPESFKKIVDFINEEKSELRKAFNNPNPQLGENVNQMRLPQICEQNREKLLQALAAGNPLRPILEKVELAELPQTELSRPRIVAINKHFVNIVERLNTAIKRMQKMIAEDEVFLEKQSEFADLHKKFDELQLLNTACVRMYNRICSVIANKVPGETRRTAILVDIQWLGEYIEEMLEKINEEYIQEMLAQMNVPDHPPFLKMAAAREAKELPEELELNVGKMKEIGTKESAALIAQNMLFMVAQMDKIYNLELVVENFLMARPMWGVDRETRLAAMINRDKELPPKQFGQFIFQKYIKDALQAHQAAGGSSGLVKGKKQMEIGQQSAAGGQHSKHSVKEGGSSSTKTSAAQEENMEGEEDEKDWVFI